MLVCWPNLCVVSLYMYDIDVGVWAIAMWLSVTMNGPIVMWCWALLWAALSVVGRSTTQPAQLKIQHDPLHYTKLHQLKANIIKIFLTKHTRKSFNWSELEEISKYEAWSPEEIYINNFLFVFSKYWLCFRRFLVLEREQERKRERGKESISDRSRHSVLYIRATNDYSCSLSPFLSKTLL